MFENIKNLFRELTKEYLSRSEAMFNEKEVIFLHVVGDSMIALTWLIIGGLMIYASFNVPRVFNRKIFFLIGLCMTLVSITFMIDVVSITHTFYKIDGWIKLASGMVSIATLVMLPRTTRRLKEFSEYEVLRVEAISAREKAEEAEAKADKLLEIVKKYKIEGY